LEINRSGYWLGVKGFRVAAQQSDLQIDELFYRLDEALAATKQAMLVLDDKGYVVYSSRLAEDLLGIVTDASDHGRRRIQAQLVSLSDTPIHSIAECKPESFPLSLLVRREGRPDSLLKVSGLPNRRTYLIQDLSHEMQRSAADRELIDIAAHDLRAGLVPAKTYAQMMLTSIFGPLNEKQTEALQSIDSCVQKQAEKISGLLDMVKAEEKRLEVQLETANLADILKHTLNVIERDCRRRKLRVVSDLDLRAALVESDVPRLQRIFTSLMMRGIKQSSSGGAVGIELKYLPNNRARLRFWDLGSGSAAADLEALTIPASTLAMQRSKSNCQMDIELGGVFDILQQHHGSIETDSEPGAGTTYKVYLPIRQKTGAASVRGTQRLPLLNALVAHNDEAEAETLIEVLQSRGVNVTRANSGIDAVKAAREKHFTLVFVSASLSGLDPQRVQSSIRSQRVEDPQQMCLIRHDSLTGDSMQNGNDTWLGSIKTRDVAENVVSEMISKLIEAP
jgi:signal transduction histidine kinase